MLKEIKIELTNKCARNCRHCSSNAQNSDYYFLDTKLVKKVLEEAAKLGVESIVFSGGEPLEDARLGDFIKMTKDLGMQASVYSFAYRNAINLEKFQILIDKGLDKIVYSLASNLSDTLDLSTYTLKEFFDELLLNKDTTLSFHYALSRESFGYLEDIFAKTLATFKDSSYFQQISLLRFVAHGRGNKMMNLTKEQLLALKEFYLNLQEKDKIRLGSPWNILGLKYVPCVVGDEIMIIGLDKIAYPCDSLKYFNKYGQSGSIQDKSLLELYNSEYFQTLRELKVASKCHNCSFFNNCQSGCLGQKIINNEEVMSLKKVLNNKDPLCGR